MGWVGLGLNVGQEYNLVGTLLVEVEHFLHGIMIIYGCPRAPQKQKLTRHVHSKGRRQHK